MVGVIHRRTIAGDEGQVFESHGFRTSEIEGICTRCLYDYYRVVPSAQETYRFARERCAPYRGRNHPAPRRDKDGPSLSAFADLYQSILKGNTVVVRVVWHTTF